MFEHILLAHHNLEIRNIVYEALSQKGYQVTTAPGYTDIWKILEKERPDYIFLADSPQINDLSEKIRSIDKNIRLIILKPEDQTPLGILENINAALKNSSVPEAKDKPASFLKFKANILVVDNEKECTQLIQKYLTRKGFQVDTAFSGEEALLKINSFRPDIVLLDIYMTGVDGLIVLKNIKSTNPNIVVIMTSSVADPVVINEASSLGAEGYLTKPFDLEKLERTIIDTALKR